MFMGHCLGRTSRCESQWYEQWSSVSIFLWFAERFLAAIPMYWNMTFAISIQMNRPLRFIMDNNVGDFTLLVLTYCEILKERPPNAWQSALSSVIIASDSSESMKDPNMQENAILDLRHWKSHMITMLMIEIVSFEMTISGLMKDSNVGVLKTIYSVILKEPRQSVKRSVSSSVKTAWDLFVWMMDRSTLRNATFDPRDWRIPMITRPMTEIVLFEMHSVCPILISCLRGMLRHTLPPNVWCVLYLDLSWIRLDAVHRLWWTTMLGNWRWFGKRFRGDCCRMPGKVHWARWGVRWLCTCQWWIPICWKVLL